MSENASSGSSSSAPGLLVCGFACLAPREPPPPLPASFKSFAVVLVLAPGGLAELLLAWFPMLMGQGNQIYVNTIHDTVLLQVTDHWQQELNGN